MATSDGLLATCGVPPLAAPHARLARLRLIAFSQASSKRCGLLQGRTAHALYIQDVNHVHLGCSAIEPPVQEWEADDAVPLT